MGTAERDSLAQWIKHMAWYQDTTAKALLSSVSLAKSLSLSELFLAFKYITCAYMTNVWQKSNERTIKALEK